MQNLKTKFKKCFLLLTAVVFMGILAAIFMPANIASAQYVSPSCNSAVLNGNVVTNGATTTVWFEWGPGSSIIYSTSRQTFSSNSNFSQTITGLTENTLYSYRAMASNQNGTSTGATLTFTTKTCTQTPQPTVSITADNTTINYNGSTTVRWSSANATSCTASGGTNGWAGSKSLSGSFHTGTLTSNTTYHINCSNNVGSANASVTVTVGTPPIAVCQDPSAINYGGPLPCTYNQPNNPTVNISASPSSVSYNGTSTVTWNSTNATSCNASGGTNGWSGSRNLSGSFFTGNLTNTITYSIVCSNSTGSATASTTIYVNNTQNDPTVNIRADDTRIKNGDSTVIRWNSSNADTCTASNGRNNWSGSRSLSGSFYTGSLHNDTTYKITCTNNSGSATDSVTVRVDDDNNNNRTPSVNIYSNPSTVAYNSGSTISWNSSNADTCTASGGTNGWSGNRGTSGTFYTGGLTYNTTYSINCRNNSGSSTDSTTVYVTTVYTPPVNNAPTVYIYADSTNVGFNGSTTIRWSTTNATTCTATNGSQGWAGPKSIGPGSFFTGSLTGTRTYSLTCSNNTGSATDFVTVSVRGQVLGVATPKSAYLIVSSSVDRNKAIVPTLDNTNPCPGDEINYTLTYQNVGNGSVSNLVLRVDLPNEVAYLSASPVNPSHTGQTLIFNLGTLGANKSGSVSVRVRLHDNVTAGTPLNFPAVMTYTDPSGSTQSVNANVAANVCSTASNGVALSANVFGAGFLPTSIVGWLLLIILILILVLLAKHLFGQSFQRRTVTTYNPANGQSTTTTL